MKNTLHDDDHECPAPDCERAVPRHMLACRQHWFSIPKRLRDAVWRAYNGPGPGSPEHAKAVLAAVESLKP